MSKETKGRRRKRLFAGMTLADLRLLRDDYKGGTLIRGIKIEELVAEIERREKIGARSKDQPRAGGRFAQVPKEELTLTAAINKGRFLAAAKACAKKPEDEVTVPTYVVVVDWAEVEVSLRRIVREEIADTWAESIVDLVRLVTPKPKRRGLWQRWFGWPE